MLRLNLLTTDQKIRLRRYLVTLNARNALLALFVESAAFGAALLIGQAILDRTFRDVVEQSVSISRSFSADNKEIRTLNRELSELETIGRQFVPVGDLYGDIVSLVPAEVTLSSLVMDVTGQQVRIRGSARTRADLNAFNDALTGSPIVSEVRSPLSNLFVKDDIPFEFSAKLSAASVPVPAFPAAGAARTSATSTL